MHGGSQSYILADFYGKLYGSLVDKGVDQVIRRKKPVSETYAIFS